MAPRPNPTEKERRRAEILDEVLRSHGNLLRNQARYHSNRSDNADDALDDACVAFLRSYNGGPGEHALRYLMVVVKTAAWEIDRRRRAVAAHNDEGAAPEDFQRDLIARAVDFTEAPDVQYERAEEIRERVELLSRLKPDERTALVLFACGYSYREIGARQGWTYTKVNRCIAEGRERLRELLPAEGERS